MSPRRRPRTATARPPRARCPTSRRRSGSRPPPARGSRRRSRRATPAQVGAWDADLLRQHALVVAPTGSGKTLAAFLWALDRVAVGTRARRPARRCRVLYVSPLKALAVDVERNLRSPLTGIRREAARGSGWTSPTITVGVRSGDTPADERRRLRQPAPRRPHHHAGVAVPAC